MSVSFVVPVWREDVYKTVCKPWIERQVQYGGELIEVRGKKSIFESLEEGRKRAKYDYIFYSHDDTALIWPDNLIQEIPRLFKRHPKVGLMGPVGCRPRALKSLVIPWTKNISGRIGHCVRRNPAAFTYIYAINGRNRHARLSKQNPAESFLKIKNRWHQVGSAAMVDGFFLIEDRNRVNIPWDTETYGEQWHGYDMDRSLQTHKLGYGVAVSPFLFLHDNAFHEGHAGYKGTDPHIKEGRTRDGKKIKSKGDELWLEDYKVVNQMVAKKWGLRCK